MLMDLIVAEAVYVLRRIYKHSKDDISSVLKRLLLYKHLYTENKLITFEALDIYANQNIDFADAMLCAKHKMEGFEIISFDKDIGRCTISTSQDSPKQDNKTSDSMFLEE